MLHLNTDRILIPIDFSDTSSLAIMHGAFLAQYLKGEVFLVHVIKKSEVLDMLLPLIDVIGLSKITRIVEDKLTDLAAQVKKEYGIKVTTLVSTGNVTSEIVNMAKENKVGMIVMGTQGYTAFEEFLVGSNAYRVLTKSGVPVMTVRTAAGKLGYKHIVLPIDFSDHSRQKVNATVDFAEKFGAQIHIVGVLGADDKEHEDKMNMYMKQVADYAEKKGVRTTSIIQHASNRAHQTLKYAKSINADLIVTMADQDAEISSLVLGSYAHQLINYSKVPVVTFIPEVHEENIHFSFAGMS